VRNEGNSPACLTGVEETSSGIKEFGKITGRKQGREHCGRLQGNGTSFERLKDRGVF